MGSRFSEAVPDRHIPLLVLCRCCSPSVCSLSVMAYFSGVIAVRTVIQLSFAPPFCFWILGYVWERAIKKQTQKTAHGLFPQSVMYLQTGQICYISSVVNSIIIKTSVRVKPCFEKILRVANQTVSGGANAKKTRPLKPSCMGRPSGAFAVYCQRNRRSANHV